MQGDGQIGVVDRPQFLKGAFRLAAGVDEEQRHLRLFYFFIDSQQSRSKNFRLKP